ncbi:MAG: hypothetical protein N5P05_003927 [Chroococcopsis gigantea SAG 12.99]|jgi:hypothetical protein|nr:O-antigen ligase domain-containing protein [Chlorogloea purpurea SAG 13.99]MDV3002321.1 hypothetical protein [Chroococcopsis gigantea SAG 12.99]
MTPQALLVVIAWLPFTLYLFNRYNPRTASIVSFVGGFLFLPQRAGISLPLIPDFANNTVASYSITLGLLLFDQKRLLNFRFSWFDVPMLVWTLSPIAASLSNGLGFYDGINIAFTQVAIWGWPYIIGRLYLSSLLGMSELCSLIIKGGLIYAPMCLIEIRISPQFHHFIYGYYAHPSGLSQAIRYGGWRPMVFMSHGLVLGLWMMVVTLVAVWLWQAKKIKQVWGIPMMWVAIILVITFILIKSTGAYVYFAVGLGILAGAKWGKNSWLLYLLVGGIILYLSMNISGNFNGKSITSRLSNFVQPDRVESLQFRFDNEVLLTNKAREKLLFGWGGWGRNRVLEENSAGELEDVSVTDSYWVIVFGTSGLFGIVSLYSSLLLPLVLFSVKRFPAKTWLHPDVAPSSALVVSLALFTFDTLINSTFISVYPLICGGITGLVAQPRRTKTQVSLQPSSQRRRPALPLKE